MSCSIAVGDRCGGRESVRLDGRRWDDDSTEPTDGIG
jgi:hypothetical protein